MKAFVYRTPTATSIGGRDGSVRSADGLIDLQVAVPKEMGGPGGKTNPEELALCRGLRRMLPRCAEWRGGRSALILPASKYAPCAKSQRDGQQGSNRIGGIR